MEGESDESVGDLPLRADQLPHGSEPPQQAQGPALPVVRAQARSGREQARQGATDDPGTELPGASSVGAGAPDPEENIRRWILELRSDSKRWALQLQDEVRQLRDLTIRCGKYSTDLGTYVQREFQGLGDKLARPRCARCGSPHHCGAGPGRAAGFRTDFWVGAAVGTVSSLIGVALALAM